MAKKNEIKKIAPSLCIESLTKYLEAITMLKAILPSAVECLRGDFYNKEFARSIADTIESNLNNLKSFYDAE